MSTPREETIVDFLLRRPDGRYLGLSTKTPRRYQLRHNNARSFSTRADADATQRLMPTLTVVRRVATLYWEEK